jgi:toxin CcdB
MQQCDVFRNPSVQTRKAMPYLIVLQHDRGSETSYVIVAALVPPLKSGIASRLYPVLQVEGKQLMLLTPDLASLPRTALKQRIANLEHERSRIIAALDLLFAGS